MKNNRWKKALSVALVCCMLAGTGLTSEDRGVEFDATLKEGGMSVSNKIQPTVKEVKKDTAIIEVPEDQIVKMIW